VLICPIIISMESKNTMTKIYRLDDSTLYLCNNCLDELGPVPGKWNETPLEYCSVCSNVDLEAQEEMQQWSTEQDQQSWEEDQIDPEIYNEQDLK